AALRAEGEGVGAPMKHVSLSVNDDSSLQVRGAAVAQTYWPEMEPILGGGCYQTSDLAELKDGLVFLRGRASDQINIAGRKLSPEVIEKVLASHSQVRDCLVFGVPAPEPGRSEIVLACVVARAEVAGEHLKQFRLSHLPAWQVPQESIFLESLAPH